MAMSDTNITFLRHGVTDWNLEARWQGQTDIPLNGQGEQQALAVAERLAAVPFDVILSSDLSRAAETARAVLRMKGSSDITFDACWRERHAGVFEGLISPEIEQDYPEEYAAIMRGKLEPPEGESFTDFTARIRTGLEGILAEHAGKSVLVVSHGGTIRGVAHITLGVPQERTWSYSVGNTALSQFTHTERGWKLVNWNDTNHLTTRNTPEKQASLTI